jgi:hypothetical protein
MAHPRVALGHADIPESPDRFTDLSLDAVTALAERVVSSCCDLPGMVRGQNVLVKPNLVRPNFRSPRSIVTDERVILAMAR